MTKDFYDLLFLKKNIEIKEKYQLNFTKAFPKIFENLIFHCFQKIHNSTNSVIHQPKDHSKFA